MRVPWGSSMEVSCKHSTPMEVPWEGSCESHCKNHRSSMRVISPHGRAMTVGTRESSLDIPWGSEGRSMTASHDDAFPRKFHGSPWEYYNSMGVLEARWKSPKAIPRGPMRVPWKAHERPMETPRGCYKPPGVSRQSHGSTTKVSWKSHESIRTSQEFTWASTSMEIL